MQRRGEAEESDEFKESSEILITLGVRLINFHNLGMDTEVYKIPERTRERATTSTDSVTGNGILKSQRRISARKPTALQSQRHTIGILKQVVLVVIFSVVPRLQRSNFGHDLALDTEIVNHNAT